MRRRPWPPCEAAGRDRRAAAGSSRRRRQVDPGEVVVDNLAVGRDGEVGGDQAARAGEGAVTPRDGPQHTSDRPTRPRRRRYPAAPDRLEGHRAAATVGDPAVLDERPVAEALDARLEYGALADRRGDARADSVGPEHGGHRLAGRVRTRDRDRRSRAWCSSSYRSPWPATALSIPRTRRSRSRP